VCQRVKEAENYMSTSLTKIANDKAAPPKKRDEKKKK
jgi:hypothetical protein